jgi:hypothetical protein
LNLSNKIHTKDFGSLLQRQLWISLASILLSVLLSRLMITTVLSLFKDFKTLMKRISKRQKYLHGMENMMKLKIFTEPSIEKI